MHSSACGSASLRLEERGLLLTQIICEQTALHLAYMCIGSVQRQSCSF
jgi:hypothetical protein